jgi:hypothetical protein
MSQSNHVDPSRSSSASPPYTFDTGEEIAHLLRGKRSGAGWSAPCPAHEDEHESLSIGEGRDGKLLLKCHAGCTFEEILAAIKALGGSQPRAARPATAPETLTVVAEYGYTNADGTPFATKTRYVNEQGEKTFRWKKGGKPTLGEAKAPLYRLHEIQAKEAVYIAEGEKDVNRLWSLGLPATCNPDGASKNTQRSKWTDEHSQQLVEASVKRVAILADHDEAGLAHAHAVARACQSAGIITKLVELPDLTEHQDVSDWLDADHTKADLKARVQWTVEYVAAPEPKVTVVEPEDDDERQMIQSTPLPEAAQIGLAHEFASLFQGRSDAPYPFLYLSFLTAFAAAISPYVTVGAGFSSERVGLYTVLIGASHAGRKTVSRRWVLDFFEGLESPWNTHLYVPGSVPGSEVGLVKVAKKAEGKPMLLNPDEFSELTGKINIKGSVYTEMLNKLFDAQVIGGISKTFDVEARVEFSLLSATTDSLWMESFTSDTMQVGFLNRLFVVPAYRTEHRQSAQEPDSAMVAEIRARVTRALRRVAQAPVRLEMSPEALAVYVAWSLRCEQTPSDGKGTPKMIYHEAWLGSRPTPSGWPRP